MWQQWLKIKWNAVQCKIKSGGVIYGKEGFSFYILYSLKIWHNFEMEICLLRGERKGEY